MANPDGRGKSFLVNENGTVVPLLTSAVFTPWRPFTPAPAGLNAGMLLTQSLTPLLSLFRLMSSAAWAANLSPLCLGLGLGRMTGGGGIPEIANHHFVTFQPKLGKNRTPCGP